MQRKFDLSVNLTCNKAQYCHYGRINLCIFVESEKISVEKTTLVLGASLNPERYSHIAVRKLKYNHYKVVAIGFREGEISGVRIDKPFTRFENIDTVTLYMGPKALAQYEEYLLELRPARVIFNPGTENPIFAEKLIKTGITVVEGCTLIMISSGEY
jgi:predicted CoA-binding protein